MPPIRVRDWARVADVAIAFGLLIPALVEVWVTPFLTDHVNGSRWLNTTFLLVAALPALWRRTRPEVAFAVFAAGWATYVLVLYPRQVDAPGETWAMLLLAWFALGYYGRRSRTALAVSFGLVGFLAVNARQLAAGVSAPEVLSAWIFPTGAWLLGRVLQRRDLLAGRLRHRAEESERERVEEAGRIVAFERARIARELHDVISHSVGVIVMQAAVEGRLLGDGHPRYRETLLGIERAGREALAELRTLLGVLHDERPEAELAPLPGLAQLTALVERVRSAGLPVALRVDDPPGALPPGLELAAYRVVQEGLTNALKHARASHADVAVRFGSVQVEIEVEDDGRGPNGSPPGRGLIGLKERVQLYGGDVETLARAGGGFILRSRIPLGVVGV